MSWWWVLAASGACFGAKVAGYLLPAGLVDRPVVARVGLLLPVALLAALAALDTVTAGGRLVIDARLPAVVVAGAAIWRRAPFIAVVVLAALASALWRLAAGS